MYQLILALRRRRLLVTTNTELNAIALAASIGLRKPNAADGNQDNVVEKRPEKVLFDLFARFSWKG